MSDREAPPVPLLSPAPGALGVHLTQGSAIFRIWSAQAAEIELVILDDDDLDWEVAVLPLRRGADDVWEVTTDLLRHETRYGVRVHSQPNDRLHAQPSLVLDPYGRGTTSTSGGELRSVVVDTRFAWQGSQRPNHPWDDTVIYEAHVRGLTKRHPDLPPALHGTYAGLGHEVTIAHLRNLGVTAVELLPIHAFTSEPHLLRSGLTNYWGYNTASFFAPHDAYATHESRTAGPSAVLRELKEAVRSLHNAGIEVILDVVYNHTSEGSGDGPVSSFRAIDDSGYFRKLDDGTYVDTTGCGNAIDTSSHAAAQLILDSVRYWSEDVQIDGFRFDLAATLGRDSGHVFTPDHPLLVALREYGQRTGIKMIAEPWDVGMGGWQTGAFGQGWAEWNDRYRDRVRNFWLSDIDYARRASTSPVGVGGLATRLAGSSNTFSADRGPLAGINFLTAHDGFTLRDLVSYDVKHNEANGENNRDGTDTNRSFNHGSEGETENPAILATRRRAMRNLMGTLLLSAGVPMITAGDEFARSQYGNNNAYCHDSPLTWMSWQHEAWQEDMRAHTSRLLELRRENRALRPRLFADDTHPVPFSSAMTWFDERGQTMSHEQWTDAAHRTLQYLAEAVSPEEPNNRILLIIHGRETSIDVTLPTLSHEVEYVSLWSSLDEQPSQDHARHHPGAVVTIPTTGLWLFRVEGSASPR